MPLETPHKPIEMLLVEDSPPDVLMAKAALETAKLLFDLYVVEDGDEALQDLEEAADDRERDAGQPPMA
jgi:CheY-like chemotaxis protein